jgi:hypothetical protein
MLAGVESWKKLKIDNEESASSGGSAGVPPAVSRILRDTLQRFLNREWTRRNANGKKSYWVLVIGAD